MKKLILIIGFTLLSSPVFAVDQPQSVEIHCQDGYHLEGNIYKSKDDGYGCSNSDFKCEDKKTDAKLICVMNKNIVFIDM